MNATTELPVTHDLAKVSVSDTGLHWLEEDYTNHAGDQFHKHEPLEFTNNKEQLTRLGAKLGDPAIVFYEIVDLDNSVVDAREAFGGK